MSETVIEDLDQVTADWLTRVLKRSGALHAGGVATFQVRELIERELSTSARLELNYQTGSRGVMPRNLFLKMVSLWTDDDESLLPTEVTYYTRDYAGLKHAPLVPCYDAQFSEEEQRYHILIADLSETHVTALEKSVTLDHGLALAEGLAALHARWWGAEKLSRAGESLPSSRRIRRFVAIAHSGLPNIMECCAADLGSRWSDTLGDIFDHHPAAMIERARDDTGFTLIHGDVYPGNILVPKVGARPLYIIDRQPFEWSLTVWLGVCDLSYAMINYWPVAKRRELESEVLHHYHAQLERFGVDDYPWEMLVDDYRLSAVLSVYAAAEWCRGDEFLEWKDHWMTMLRRALTAYDDLRAVPNVG